MKAGWKQILVLALVGMLFWQVVTWVTGATEPWDAEGYWSLWYPLSLVLSGCGSFWIRTHGWLAGLIVTFSQLPGMWIGSGPGPLWALGLLMLVALALPAIAVSALAARFGNATKRT